MHYSVGIIAVKTLVELWLRIEPLKTGSLLMRKLDEYVKIAEAAEILGVSQNTLRKWVDEGRIAASVNPANGYRLFRPEDLEKFLKKAAKPTRRKRKRSLK